MSEASVDPDEVQHVADLARVDLDAEECDRFAGQFQAVLEHFETLEEAPELEADPDLVNVFRPDETGECLSQEAALSNAPETEDGFFKGPRVS